jgi:hypothetical protein
VVTKESATKTQAEKEGAMRGDTLMKILESKPQVNAMNDSQYFYISNGKKEGLYSFCIININTTTKRKKPKKNCTNPNINLYKGA